LFIIVSLFGIQGQIFTDSQLIFKKQAIMEGTRRADVKPGIDVMIELPEDKRTGRLTWGRVKEVLTTAPIHPHGIKVKLENGLVGRIKQII
jgi:uncharacterized repeat protein (TIGR03833 family)